MTFIETLTAVVRFLEPTWLTGPLLDKELRVASRRRRTYIVRGGYLLGLLIFIALAWSSAAVTSHFTGSGAYIVSRMPFIGRQVTCAIVWFQFFTAQLIIIAMLCSCLSDEITKRTLDVLLSTPVTALQLVAGKFLSRCFQVMILIAVSLPVLAVIRVFGGVSWNFVIASLAVTLAAMVFAGALSLLGSVFFHRTHRCIIIVVGVLLAMNLLPPLLALLPLPSALARALEVVTKYTNATVILSELTTSEFWVDPAGANIDWPGLCRTLGLVSLGLLLAAVVAVRLLVRGSLAGLNPKNWFLGPRARLLALTGSTGIRPVTGQPVCWKDLRHCLWRRGRAGQLILVILALLVAALYGWGIIGNWIIRPEFHMILLSILSLLCLLRTGAAAAVGITGEKEARTLDCLLTSPLDDNVIVWGKALAAVGRSLVLLVWMLGHMVAFIIVGVIHPVAIFFFLLTLAGNLVLVIGIGLYFSVRLKTTIAALVASFVTVMVLLNFCCGFMSNPISAVAVMVNFSSSGSPGWGFSPFIFLFFVGPVIHTIIGMIFYGRARANLRRR